MARRNSRAFGNVSHVQSLIRQALPKTWKIATLEDDVHPPLRRVRKLFADAAIVVGAHGAALTNIIFCTRPVTVVELAKVQPHSAYMVHLAMALGFRYWWWPARDLAMHYRETVSEHAIADLPAVLDAVVHDITSLPVSDKREL